MLFLTFILAVIYLFAILFKVLTFPIVVAIIVIFSMINYLDREQRNAMYKAYAIISTCVYIILSQSLAYIFSINLPILALNIYILIILGLWYRDAIDPNELREILNETNKEIDSKDPPTRKDYINQGFEIAKFVAQKIFLPTRFAIYVGVIILTVLTIYYL